MMDRTVAESTSDPPPSSDVEKIEEAQNGSLGDSRDTAIKSKANEQVIEEETAAATASTSKEVNNGSRPGLIRQPSILKNPSKVPGSRWKTLLAWLSLQEVFLENTASVARDHLANERSYLAWLRTSITLASIGVVVAQLFRLSSSIFTLSDNPYNTTIDITSIDTDISPSDLSQIVAQLVSASQRQETILLTLLAAQKEERHRYQNLGKPLGATFLMISVLFVLLGNYRYLSVQYFLTANNYFPPARRSVLISSSTMLALTVTTFSLILVLK